MSARHRGSRKVLYPTTPSPPAPKKMFFCVFPHHNISPAPKISAEKKPRTSPANENRETPKKSLKLAAYPKNKKTRCCCVPKVRLNSGHKMPLSLFLPKTARNRIKRQKN